MKELSKVFKGTSLLVEETESGLYFDVSGIANKYGKNFRDYTKRNEFKEYLKIVLRVHSLKETEMIKRVGHQIKIHEDLLIDFARWINIEFSVWCDRTIKDILFGNCQQLTSQLQLSQEETKKAQLNNMKTYKDGFMSLRKYLKDNSISISEEMAWNMLIEEEVVDSRPFQVMRKFLIDDCCGRQDHEGVIEFNSRALDGIFSEYVYRAPTLF